MSHYKEKLDQENLMRLIESVRDNRKEFLLSAIHQPELVIIASHYFKRRYVTKNNIEFIRSELNTNADFIKKALKKRKRARIDSSSDDKIDNGTDDVAVAPIARALAENEDIADMEPVYKGAWWPGEKPNAAFIPELDRYDAARIFAIQETSIY